MYVIIYCPAEYRPGWFSLLPDPTSYLRPALLCKSVRRPAVIMELPTLLVPASKMKPEKTDKRKDKKRTKGRQRKDRTHSCGGGGHPPLPTISLSGVLPRHLPPAPLPFPSRAESFPQKGQYHWSYLPPAKQGADRGSLRCFRIHPSKPCPSSPPTPLPSP